MRGTKALILFSVVMLFSLVLFAFADSTAKAVQAVESDARIIYNGKEAVLSIKPYSIAGYNYLSIRSVAELFGKSIDWNQAERKVIISDPPNYELDSLKAELAAKNKSIAELQEKVNSLEKSLSIGKKPSIRELQDEINYALGEYEGVLYKAILSGNEDEIRVKIEIDLSRDKTAWNRLSSDEKKELIYEVYKWIIGEYEFAKVKGYVVDISQSKKQMSFHFNWKEELAYNYNKNYSTISSLEDKLNNNYSNFFRDMHFSIALMGNDNRVEFYLNIQEDRFDREWENLSDASLRNYMRKLCSEINLEFKDCNVFGYVYDTDGEIVLASCEQIPGGSFIFSRDF